jgi:hypothetical protein
MITLGEEKIKEYCGGPKNRTQEDGDRMAKWKSRLTPGCEQMVLPPSERSHGRKSQLRKNSSLEHIMIEGTQPDFWTESMGQG